MMDILTGAIPLWPLLVVAGDDRLIRVAQTERCLVHDDWCAPTVQPLVLMLWRRWYGRFATASQRRIEV